MRAAAALAMVRAAAVGAGGFEPLRMIETIVLAMTAGV